MDTQNELLGSSYEDHYGFPSDEELTALTDAVFVTFDDEERSTNAPDKP